MMTTRFTFEVGKIYRWSYLTGPKNRSNWPTISAPDRGIVHIQDERGQKYIGQTTPDADLVVLEVKNENWWCEPLPENEDHIKIRVLTPEGQTGWIMAYIGPSHRWERKVSP